MSNRAESHRADRGGLRKIPRSAPTMLLGLLTLGCASRQVMGRGQSEGCERTSEPALSWHRSGLELRSRSDERAGGSLTFPSPVQAACRHADVVYVGLAGESAAVVQLRGPHAPRIVGRLDGVKNVRRFRRQQGVLQVEQEGGGDTAWYALQSPEAPRLLRRLQTAAPGFPSPCRLEPGAIRRSLLLRTGQVITGATLRFQPGEPAALCPTPRSLLTVQWSEILSAQQPPELGDDLPNAQSTYFDP